MDNQQLIVSAFICVLVPLHRKTLSYLRQSFLLLMALLRASLMQLCVSRDHELLVCHCLALITPQYLCLILSVQQRSHFLSVASFLSNLYWIICSLMLAICCKQFFLEFSCSMVAVLLKTGRAIPPNLTGKGS